MSKKKNSARVPNATKKILELISNDDFIRKQAPYIRIDQHMIASKINNIIYEKRKQINVKEQIEGLINYLNKNLPGHALAQGSVFLLPYSSIIGLPTPYHATRFYKDKGYLLFSIIVNVSANFGKDKEPMLYGFSYIFCGKLYTIESINIKNDFTESINYLNDVLTAYRLVRHDHNIQEVNIQKLPSNIDDYKVSLLPKLSLINLDPLKLHSHDLVDIWAKRFPDSNEAMQKFVEFSEKLPPHIEERYLLKIMIDSITKFCLGDLEDTVLDSDRFAELGLRFCFTKTTSLQSYDVSKLYNLYSKSDPNSAVLNILAEEFKLKGNHIISLWYKNSRMLRNDLVHGLKFNTLTRNKARNALKYNLEIVKLIADKVPIDDWSLKLLVMGVDTYNNLFEN